MGPTERVARARTALAALDLPAGSRVLVACSGGADSLALAATLAHTAERQGWVAGAVVVDHGLREDSAADAERAAELCRSLGLPAQIRRVEVTVEPGSGGPEADARDARYAALEAASNEAAANGPAPEGPAADGPAADNPAADGPAADNPAADGPAGITAVASRGGARAQPAIVLLGHTLDDQAETVLLGLARGSGARSLAGMARTSGRYRRPFLDLTRADTVGICADLGLVPVADPTNHPDGPWRRADGGPLRRAALRHHVIPALEEALGPGVVPALARTADLLRADADHLDALADRALAAARIDDGVGHPASGDGAARPTSGGEGEASPSSITLRVEDLEGLPDAVRTRALHRAIMDVAPPGARGAVGSRHVEAVDRLLVSYRGQGPSQLPGFVTARRQGGQLVIAHEPREE